jgi:hypothetical protein
MSGTAFRNGRTVSYYDHRNEIAQHIHEADTLVQTLKQDIPSKLSQQRVARDARGIFLLDMPLSQAL